MSTDNIKQDFNTWEQLTTIVKNPFITILILFLVFFKLFKKSVPYSISLSVAGYSIILYYWWNRSIKLADSTLGTIAFNLTNDPPPIDPTIDPTIAPTIAPTINPPFDPTIAPPHFINYH